MHRISQRFVIALACSCLAVSIAAACRSKRESAAEPVPVAPAPPQVEVSTAPPAPEPVVAPPRVENVAATIEELLHTIASSRLTFIRNGSNHTGKEAEAHIRSKYEHVRDEVKTPEDFIVKAASKSIVSGKPYLVVLENGTRQPLAEWLGERLAALRQRP